MTSSRITIFAGHYGSGKTSLAVNYALWLKETYEKVVICDLDIVNPYFRTVDSAELLKARGVELISSAYANTNIDVPAIPSAAKSVFENKELRAVIDLGGDDRGALALGRYARVIVEENDYEMLLVTNKYRPLTGDADALLEIKNEIERAAGIKFTGIVNNSNLGEETTVKNVIDSTSFVLELSEKIKLPVKIVSVDESVLSSAGAAAPEFIPGAEVFPIKIYKKSLWKI